jgi:hypothetical protein
MEFHNVMAGDGWMGETLNEMPALKRLRVVPRFDDIAFAGNRLD